METMLRAALVVLSVLPEVERVWGQRAPCYECEVYKDAHPLSRPYEEVSLNCIVAVMIPCLLVNNVKTKHVACTIPCMKVHFLFMYEQTNAYW